MPTMTGGNGAFTPATTADNWNLDSQTAGVFGKVIAVGWGGRLTTSTGYRTRWTRGSSSGTSTFTSLVPAFHQPNYVTFGSRIGTFATPGGVVADPGGNLFAQDWNAQGGLGMIVMPLANPWWIVNGVSTGQIFCRNVAGTDANGSSYEVTVEE